MTDQADHLETLETDLSAGVQDTATKDKFVGEPWDRQPNESVEAFQAFETYIRLGAIRSNRATARELKKSKALMDRWSSRWRWVRRAELWESDQWRQWQQELKLQRKHAARRQIESGVKLQTAAMRCLQLKFGDNFEKLTADDLKNGELLRFLTEGIKIERIALGEPGEIQETQHTGGVPESERKAIIPLTFEGRIEDAYALLDVARQRAEAEVADTTEGKPE